MELIHETAPPKCQQSCAYRRNDHCWTDGCPLDHPDTPDNWDCDSCPYGTCYECVKYGVPNF